MSVAPVPVPSQLAAREAALIGYDVRGFSRTVERAELSQGRAAGELAAARILAGQSAIGAVLAAGGFEVVDSIGDGAIWARTQPSPGPDDAATFRRLVAELRYVHQQATGLDVRAAWSYGPLRRWFPPVPLVEQKVFVSGDGLVRLHERVRAAEAGPTIAAARAAPDTLPGREGRLVDRIFAFLRLAGPGVTVDEERLGEALVALEHWVRAVGGELQRLTQDEKGLHLRAGLPQDLAEGVGCQDALGAAADLLRGVGFDGAVGAARGAAYFGTAADGQPLVHGSAVNRAAKLMHAARAGEVALDAGLERRSIQRSNSSELIGRDSELAAAAQWLARDGRLVVIGGEPGIGKTRLMRSLLDRLPGADPIWTDGAPSRALRPLGVWREALRAALDRLPGDQGPEHRLRWLRETLEEADVDSASLAFVAADLGGGTVEDPTVQALPGGARARLAEQALAAVAVRLGADGLTLAFDDLHLADPPSLALTATLLDRDAPIRIVATARPTGDPALEALGRHISALALPLGPLPATALSRLVRRLAPDLDETNTAASLAGGNPLAAIQIALAAAVGADATDVGQVLARRLDGLGAGDGEVLRAIATGERGWRPEQLGTIVHLAPDELAAALARLRTARLVGGHGARLTAAHPLVREAVLRHAPLGVRHRLAERCAYAFRAEGREGHRAGLAELAGLWGAAGRNGRAALLYETAARQALDEGGADAAARLYELALAAAPTCSRRLRWMAELANARWAHGQLGAANRVARDVLKEARRSPVTPALRASAILAAAVRTETGTFLGDLGDMLGGAVTANRYAAGSRQHLEAKGRTLSSLGYLVAIARVPWLCEHLVRAGCRLSDDSGDPRPRGFVLTCRGIVSYVFTRWAVGDAALREARDCCTGIGEHHLEEVLQTTLGMGGHMQGDAARALEHFGDLGRRAVARGHRLHQAWASYATAQTLMHVGEPHRAWELLGIADGLLESLEDRQSLHICAGLRALVGWRLGDHAAALDAAEVAGAMSRTLPPTNYTSLEAYSAAPLVGAFCALSAPDPQARARGQALATQHLRDISSYATVFPFARPRLQMVLALAHAISERPDAARAIREAQSAQAHARAIGMGFETAFAEYVREQIEGRIQQET